MAIKWGRRMGVADVAARVLATVTGIIEGVRAPEAHRAPYVRALRFEFYVPRQYNADAVGQREPIPDEKFIALHSQLTGDFPGLTQSIAFPPIGHGMWEDDDGVVQPDECYLYDLIVEPTASRNERWYRDYFVRLLDEFLLPPDEATLGIDQQAALLILTPIGKLYRSR